MSNIPEILLHRVVVNGIRKVRENPKILDNLFPNLDQRDLKNVKDFFLSSSIEFAVNYPKAETLKLPAIIMRMQSENESQGFLNDVLGVRPGYEMNEFLGSDITPSPITTVGGNHARLVWDISVLETRYTHSSNTTTVFWDPSHNEEIIESFKGRPSESYNVTVSKGTGSGQTRTIIALRNNSLDISGTFDPQLDSSSFLDIRRTSDELTVDGQPSRVFEEDNYNYLGRGANYETQYQFGIYAGSQYEVVFLYSILKAILLSQRNYLEAQNIQALTITGSDYAPKGEYLPDLVYTRAMNVRFTYTFSFVEELENISLISVNLTSCDGTLMQNFEITI